MDELSFGQRITAFRLKKKMLQKDLAKKAGVSPTVLNYYEKDKSEPNVLTIIKIARALEISGDELLGLNGQGIFEKAMPDDVTRLIEGYNELNEQGKSLINLTMEAALNTYKKPVSILELAKYDAEIAAEISSYADELQVKKTVKGRSSASQNTKEA